MPEVIIGSPNQYMMAVNNSGAVPMAGYYNDVVYPLLVDSTGKLDTSVSGIVNTGSSIIDIFRDIDFVLNYTGNDVTSIVQTDGIQTNTLTLVYSGTAVVSGNTVIS